MAQARANIFCRLRAEIETAEFFKQPVHEREKKLALRTKVLVEAPSGKVRAACHIANRSALVTLLAEEIECRRFQPGTFFETALLMRLGREIFTGQKVWARIHALCLEGIIAPTSAPAQQQSIHPPKTPAISGSMLGNARGKKALENGSSSSVGSAKEIAPAGHCSCGSPRRRQRRRAIQPISRKLMAKRMRVGIGRPERSRCSPRMRKNRVAAIQMPRP